MKKKLLITGGEGFLGGRLAQYYQERFSVTAVGHSDLDIGEEKAVRKLVLDLHPDIVLHCAAISNTGTCEEQPVLSERINKNGTIYLAQACKETGSRLIFMSSDQIYAGSRTLTPNKESEEVPLVNVYGTHKRQAEKSVMEILPDAVCLRLPWLYDIPRAGLKTNSNLVCTLINALVNQQPVTFPVHDYRGITWVWDVVAHMESAMELPGGVYNFGGESSWSAYEIGVFFMKLLRQGMETELLIEDGKRYADCPRNLTMDSGKLKKCGIAFPETKSGLQIFYEKNKEMIESLIL